MREAREREKETQKRSQEGKTTNSAEEGVAKKHARTD